MGGAWFFMRSLNKMDMENKVFEISSLIRLLYEEDYHTIYRIISEELDEHPDKYNDLELYNLYEQIRG